MFMVQNNQTSVWYRFRLRSQMTLTGLKHQNEPNKVAAQQLIQIYIIVQNEQKNKFTSSIDSRMMKFTLHGGQVVWHVTHVKWFGKGLPTTNSTRFVPSASNPSLPAIPQAPFNSKRCQGFAFHLMILANLKGEIQIKSRRSTSHMSKRTQRVSNKLFKGTRT